MKSKLIFPVIVVAFMCLFAKVASAQYMQDLNGRPLKFTTGGYADLDGSPFLFESWVTGTVKFNNGSTYKDVVLNYDELADELYFKNKGGDTLIFVDPVHAFTVGGASSPWLFKSGYPAIGKNTSSSFYEVLADGQIQLLKKTIAELIETKEYNATLVHRALKKDTKYYIVKGGQISVVKKDKKAILAFMDDKQHEMEAFIKEFKIDVKEDADLIKLLVYYNSI